jgi:hypothetical protein
MLPLASQKNFTGTENQPQNDGKYLANPLVYREKRKPYTA